MMTGTPGSTNHDDVRVAAIIPLFDGAKYIRSALKSALTQTRPPDEIIVVDDGSTDDGPQIGERLAVGQPIRLLHKSNGGQGSARNVGVANCNADLIALLDQDDIWYRAHLEELVRPFLLARPV